MSTSNLHADCRNRDHEGSQPDAPERGYDTDPDDDAAKRRADWGLPDNKDAQEGNSKRFELSNLEISIMRAALAEYRENAREEHRAARVSSQAWAARVNEKINAALALEERLSYEKA